MARAHHVTGQDPEFERWLSRLDERRVAGTPGPNRSADEADETAEADDDDLDDDEDLDDDDDEFEDDDDSDDETAEDGGEESV